MNSVMERYIGRCRHELLERTLVWSRRHLMTVLREYQDFCDIHRPRHAVNQTAPLRPLPDGVTDSIGSGSSGVTALGRDSRISPGGIGFRAPTRASGARRVSRRRIGSAGRR
jgi:hypothetical protein